MCIRCRSTLQLDFATHSNSSIKHLINQQALIARLQFLLQNITCILYFLNQNHTFLSLYPYQPCMLGYLMSWKFPINDFFFSNLDLFWIWSKIQITRYKTHWSLIVLCQKCRQRLYVFFQDHDWMKFLTQINRCSFVTKTLHLHFIFL